VVPGATLQTIGIVTGYLIFFDFLLYSACTAVAVPYPRIASASAVVSFLNFLEVVGTLLLVALLIATVVHRSSPDNGKDKPPPDARQ
jgi:hypothetical protein